MKKAVPKYREFSNFYNEMIYWLEEARKVLLYHPLNSYPEQKIVASFCGLLVIVMISKIEYILEKWQNIGEIKEILNPYFQENKSNGEKVEALYKSFEKFLGKDVDKRVFDDYLAIKYLRNVIIHGRWKKNHKEWVKQQGFPADTRNLQEEHWQKIYGVFKKMVEYLIKVVLDKNYEVLFSEKYPDELFEIAELPLLEDNLSKYIVLRKGDIPRLFWRNLEKINDYFDKCFDKIISLKKYNWKESFTKEEIYSVDEKTLEKLKYSAIKQAVEDGIQEVIQMEKFGKDAIESWEGYWNFTFKEKSISIPVLQKATEILTELHFSGNYKKPPFFPWEQYESKDQRIKLIEAICTDRSTYTAKEIDDALFIGKTTYDLIFQPWETPLALFLLKLPIIDPSNAENYKKEGEKALLIIKLADYYHSFLEGLQPSGWIKFYEEILKDGTCNFLKGEK